MNRKFLIALIVAFVLATFVVNASANDFMQINPEDSNKPIYFGQQTNDGVVSPQDVISYTPYCSISKVNNQVFASSSGIALPAADIISIVSYLYKFDPRTGKEILVNTATDRQYNATGAHAAHDPVPYDSSYSWWVTATHTVTEDGITKTTSSYMKLK